MILSNTTHSTNHQYSYYQKSGTRIDLDILTIKDILIKAFEVSHFRGANHNPA